MKTTKEMPVFEVSRELAETLTLWKDQIRSRDYNDFSESEKDELIQIFRNCDDGEDGVDRSLYSITAYLLSTQNFTVKEKLYRVILQEERNSAKADWVYFFVNKDGVLDYTDYFQNVSVLKEPEIPEQFKAFMKEVD
jgi:hypothetical protein